MAAMGIAIAVIGLAAAMIGTPCYTQYRKRRGTDAAN